MNLPAIDLSAARKPQPRVRMRDRVFRASELDALGKAPEATPEQLQTKLKKQQEHADKADDLFNEHDVQGTGALSREEFVACLVHLGVRDRFRDKFEKKVRECMKRFDKDHNGRIDRDEFLEFHNWLVLDDALGKRKKHKKKKHHHHHHHHKGHKEHRGKHKASGTADSQTLEAIADAASVRGGDDPATAEQKASNSIDDKKFERPTSPAMIRIHGAVESKFPDSRIKRALTPIHKLHPAARKASASNDSPVTNLRRRPPSGRILESATIATTSQTGDSGGRKPLKPGVDKAVVKQHVKSALSAVREVLDGPKGQQILLLEAKMLLAEKGTRYAKCWVQRPSPQDPLGISFVIPPRIMAVGWASHAFLVISGGAHMEKHGLQIDDIVVACDDQPVSAIEDLQTASKGKQKMEFTVIRIPSSELTDLAKTQKHLEKGLKVAVKAKVTQHLLEGRAPESEA